MSIINRYVFTKKVFPNYLVMIKKKNKYYSFYQDRIILEDIGFRNRLSLLRKKKINYLVLDNLDIIEKEEYPDNQLNKYLYCSYLKEILERMKERLG